MNELQKLTGGRKPYFISAADGAVVNKKFFLIIPCQDTTITALESNAGGGIVDEKTAMNIGAKTLPAAVPINCDGKAYFTKVHLATGMVAAYEALV